MNISIIGTFPAYELFQLRNFSVGSIGWEVNQSSSGTMGQFNLGKLSSVTTSQYCKVSNIKLLLCEACGWWKETLYKKMVIVYFKHEILYNCSNSLLNSSLESFIKRNKITSNKHKLMPNLPQIDPELTSNRPQIDLDLRMNWPWIDHKLTSN